MQKICEQSSIMKGCDKKRQSTAWRTQTTKQEKNLKARMRRKNAWVDKEEAGYGMPCG